MSEELHHSDLSPSRDCDKHRNHASRIVGRVTRARMSRADLTSRY
jgi:hypothetical protein